MSERYGVKTKYRRNIFHASVADGWDRWPPVIPTVSRDKASVDVPVRNSVSSTASCEANLLASTPSRGKSSSFFRQASETKPSNDRMVDKHDAMLLNDASEPESYSICCWLEASDFDSYREEGASQIFIEKWLAQLDFDVAKDQLTDVVTI